MKKNATTPIFYSPKALKLGNIYTNVKTGKHMIWLGKGILNTNLTYYATASRLSYNVCRTLSVARAEQYLEEIERWSNESEDSCPHIDVNPTTGCFLKDNGTRGKYARYEELWEALETRGVFSPLTFTRVVPLHVTSMRDVLKRAPGESRLRVNGGSVEKYFILKRKDKQGLYTKPLWVRKSDFAISPTSKALPDDDPSWLPLKEGIDYHRMVDGRFHNVATDMSMGTPYYYVGFN